MSPVSLFELFMFIRIILMTQVLFIFVSLSICVIILRCFGYVSAKFVPQLYKSSYVPEWEGPLQCAIVMKFYQTMFSMINIIPD